MIKKKKELTTAKLKTKAIKIFNAWIRNRDKNQPCISCGNFRTLQAGHFYSAGGFNHLRFNEDNVNGQCLQCNYYLSGNLNKYRINLINKIGVERVEKLDLKAEIRTPTKNNRFLFLEIIEKYKL
jgi:hypothetical protein